MSKGEHTLSPSLPDNPDGFRIALDTSGEHADIVLQHPPLSVVIMPQRTAATDFLSAEPR